MVYRTSMTRTHRAITTLLLLSLAASSALAQSPRDPHCADPCRLLATTPLAEIATTMQSTCGVDWLIDNANDCREIDFLRRCINATASTLHGHREPRTLRGDVLVQSAPQLPVEGSVSGRAREPRRAHEADEDVRAPTGDRTAGSQGRRRVAREARGRQTRHAAARNGPMASSRMPRRSWQACARARPTNTARRCVCST